MPPEPTHARFREWFSPIVHLSSNFISRVGVVLVTIGGVLWLYLLPMALRGEVVHPYIGILIFMGLPAVFFGGLLLIAAGIAIQKHRELRRGVYPAKFPPLDFNNREFRHLLLFVGIATMANIVIGTQLVYGGVTYMDSVTFCGRTCHTVMKPEYVTYLHSPHARVACVQCHIGPGASWFVRSKLSGVHQVFAVLLNTYPRPIPVPISNLRPARETCEQCHWPARFEGNRLVIIPHYATDQANTRTTTVLLMHIGGGNGQGGIHGAHVAAGVRILYGADPSRQKVHWVEYENTRTGKKLLYVDNQTHSATIHFQTGRSMDCIDCHNQPAHQFHLPNEAMNTELAAGRIDAQLPYIKREGVALLKASYRTQQEATQSIPRALTEFYRTKFPVVAARQQQAIARSASALAQIYRDNVFPRMKIGWGYYPNNLGHMAFPGCFRCHGNLHLAGHADETLTQDCTVCHNPLAIQSPNPAILQQLGLTGTQPQGVNPGQ